MNNIKRIFYAFTTTIIVFMIYRMSILLLMVGLKSTSRQLFFTTLCLYLFIPLLKNIRLKNVDTNMCEINSKINKTYKKIKDDTITKLQGVTLKQENTSIDIDSIVINKYGVFNIVYSEYKGNIKIKEFNNWYKVVRGGVEVPIESPIEKLRKNREMLNRVFDEDQIIDLIVMVNDRVDVEEEEVSSVPIIRYDDLPSYISEYESDDEFDPEELYDKLYPLIFKTKDLEKDIELYEKYLDLKWQYRSRFAIIAFSLFFYIVKVIDLS